MTRLGRKRRVAVYLGGIEIKLREGIDGDEDVPDVGVDGLLPESLSQLCHENDLQDQTGVNVSS